MSKLLRKLPVAAPVRCGMRYRVLAGVAVLLLPALAQARLETYRFDPAHTLIGFSVDHEGFSQPFGRLKLKSGWFQFDPDDWPASRLDVLVDLASIDLGDADWEKAVKSGQFFDVKYWPTAEYFARSVAKTGKNTGVIHGELRLHGKALPLDLDFTLNRIATDPYLFKQKAGFSARARLKRSAFGMTRYNEVVGDTIDLRIEVEGIRDPDAAKRATKPATGDQAR